MAKNGGVKTKSLNKPDEVRTFDKGKVEIVNIDGRAVGGLPSCPDESGLTRFSKNFLCIDFNQGT